MKVIGIDIDKAKAIFFILERDGKGSILDLTGEMKSVTLSDDMDNSKVRAFQSTVHSFFDDIKPDKIGLLSRQSKGRFKAASLSFKIEGLIQCYQKVEIEFLSPQKLKAFFKKNDFDLVPEHSYQEDAAKLAYYMLVNSD